MIHQALMLFLFAVTADGSPAITENVPCVAAPTFEVGEEFKIQPQDQSLDDLLTKTAGDVSPEGVRKYPDFDAYYQASRGQREGKAFEAIVQDTINRRHAATGVNDRYYATASLGNPHHPADIVHVRGGKVIGQLQAKLNSNDILSALDDPRYRNMQLVTDQDTYDRLARKLEKKRQSAKTRGVSLDPRFARLEEAIDNGRLWKKFPCGAPLPTRESIATVAKNHARTHHLAKAATTAIAVTPSRKPLPVSKSPIAAPAHAGDLPTSAKTQVATRLMKSAGKTVKKAAPGVGVVLDGAQRLGEVNNTEELYNRGEIDGIERLKQHSETAAKTVGSGVGAWAGAEAGATLGATCGLVLGPMGAATGGVVGGIGGAVLGATGGEWIAANATRYIESWWYPL